MALKLSEGPFKHWQNYQWDEWVKVGREWGSRSSDGIEPKFIQNTFDRRTYEYKSTWKNARLQSDLDLKDQWNKLYINGWQCFLVRLHELVVTPPSPIDNANPAEFIADLLLEEFKVGKMISRAQLWSYVTCHILRYAGHIHNPLQVINETEILIKGPLLLKTYDVLA